MAQTISTKFAAQLNNLARDDRGYVFNVTKAVNVYDSTNLISFKIQSNLQKDTVIFGNTISKYAEIVLRNPTNSTYSWVGDTVEIYTGLTLDIAQPTEAIEYLKQGIFTVVNENKDTVNESITLELYDNMTKFNAAFGGSNNFPQTLGAFAAELCSSAGVTLATPTFTNSTILITSDPNVQAGENTLRDMLGWVCELALGNAIIGNNGQVYIKNFGATSIFTLTPDLYNDLTVSPQFGPIDSVIYQLMPQNDILFAPDILPTDYKAFTITNNPVAENQRLEMATLLYTQVNGFVYFPFNVNWRGTGHLEFMDKITIENVDATTYNTFVMNSVLTFDGSISEQLYAAAYTPTQSEVKYGLSAKEWRRQTSLVVDKVKQEIDAVVSSIEDANGIKSRLNAAELKLTPTEILSVVKSQSGMQSGDTLASTSYVSTAADATKIAAAKVVTDLYGKTISDIQTNFTFDTSGLKISKSTSDFSVKISDSEMGFYDGSAKTAYVNNGEFYIEKGTVVSSLTIGSHKIEKYSSGITIFRFVG